MREAHAMKNAAAAYSKQRSRIQKEAQAELKDESALFFQMRAMMSNKQEEAHALDLRAGHFT